MSACLLRPADQRTDPRLAVKHVPSWFPGATFKRQAVEWKKATDAMVERPFEAVTKAMVSLIDQDTQVETLDSDDLYEGRREGAPVHDPLLAERSERRRRQGAQGDGVQRCSRSGLYRYVSNPGALRRLNANSGSNFRRL